MACIDELKLPFLLFYFGIIFFVNADISKDIQSCDGYFGNKIASIACPSLDSDGGLVCIRPISLCNGVPDCPKAEDETPTHCFFHLALEKDLMSIKNILIEKLIPVRDDIAGQPINES